jgi:hypothetical protein
MIVFTCEDPTGTLPDEVSLYGTANGLEVCSDKHFSKIFSWDEIENLGGENGEGDLLDIFRITLSGDKGCVVFECDDCMELARTLEGSWGGPITVNGSKEVDQNSYLCEKRCGFKGSFEEVDAHEAKCEFTAYAWSGWSVDDADAYAQWSGDAATEKKTWDAWGDGDWDAWAESSHAQSHTLGETVHHPLFVCEDPTNELPEEVMVEVVPGEGNEGGLILFDWLGWSILYHWDDIEKMVGETSEHELDLLRVTLSHARGCIVFECEDHKELLGIQLQHCSKAETRLKMAVRMVAAASTTNMVWTSTTKDAEEKRVQNKAVGRFNCCCSHQTSTFSFGGRFNVVWPSLSSHHATGGLARASTCFKKLEGRVKDKRVQKKAVGGLALASTCLRKLEGKVKQKALKMREAKMRMRKAKLKQIEHRGGDVDAFLAEHIEFSLDVGIDKMSKKEKLLAKKRAKRKVQHNREAIERAAHEVEEAATAILLQQMQREQEQACMKAMHDMLEQENQEAREKEEQERREADAMMERIRATEEAEEAKKASEECSRYCCAFANSLDLFKLNRNLLLMDHGRSLIGQKGRK